MKARGAYAGLLLLCTLGTGALRAEVEFAGYMRTAQGGMKFVLADPEAAKTSEWLGVGGRFSGYTVTAFDAKTETLTLARDGVPTRLVLKAAQIVEPPLPALIEAGASTEPVLHAFIRKTGEQQRNRDEVFRLQARDKDLGQRLPEDHPDRVQVRRELAELDVQFQRLRIEGLRLSRILLVQQIEESAQNPARVASLQRALLNTEVQLAPLRPETQETRVRR